MRTRYTVETIRAGQPRAYADSENEYLITIEATGWSVPDGTFRPWVKHGDVEKRIIQEEAARKAGTLRGGESPEQLRAGQRDWAKALVRALCQQFREKGDQDGRTGMDAAFYPTLKNLTVDHVKGTVRALIVEAYTD